MSADNLPLGGPWIVSTPDPNRMRQSIYTLTHPTPKIEVFGTIPLIFASSLSIALSLSMLPGGSITGRMKQRRQMGRLLLFIALCRHWPVAPNSALRPRLGLRQSSL